MISHGSGELRAPVVVLPQTCQRGGSHDDRAACSMLPWDSELWSEHAAYGVMDTCMAMDEPFMGRPVACIPEACSHIIGPTADAHACASVTLCKIAILQTPRSPRVGDVPDL